MQYILLVFLLTFIDIYTKRVMEKKLKTNTLTMKENGWIKFNLCKNKGAFLGFLKNRQLILKIVSLISLILAIIVFIQCIVGKFSWIIKLGMSLILGGALGNVYERLKKMEVTDFFSFKFKPNIIFNLADMFIFIGSFFSFIGCVISWIKNS